MADEDTGKVAKVDEAAIAAQVNDRVGKVNTLVGKVSTGKARGPTGPRVSEEQAHEQAQEQARATAFFFFLLLGLACAVWSISNLLVCRTS